MAQYEMQATARTEKGSSYRKQLMQRGWVPGVLYGKEIETLPVELEWRSLNNVMNAGGRNAIINLKIGDSGEYQVMVKDMQFDVVKRFLMHVDFQQISMTDTIQITIPIHVDGEVEEGIVQALLRELTISCLPGNIPEGVSIDVSDLKVGDTIVVGDLEVPEGVEVIDEPDATVITVGSEAMEIEEEVDEELDDEEGELEETDGEAEAEEEKESSE